MAEERNRDESNRPKGFDLKVDEPAALKVICYLLTPKSSD
jgi:hypothetical protein